jgi:hypothetical protein
MNRNALEEETGFVSKLATTEALPVIVKQPDAFNVTVPVQPVKIWPAAGVAVRHTVASGA